MTPEWFVPLAAVIAAVLAFAGGLVGHLMSAKKNRADIQTDLIDQLQEERDRLDKKIEAQEERHAKDINQLNIRITGFYADKAASRNYIGRLESHIYQGNPPPPPPPPDGYVP